MGRSCGVEPGDGWDTPEDALVLEAEPFDFHRFHSSITSELGEILKEMGVEGRGDDPGEREAEPTSVIPSDGFETWGIGDCGIAEVVEEIMEEEAVERDSLGEGGLVCHEGDVDVAGGVARSVANVRFIRRLGVEFRSQAD